MRACCSSSSVNDRRGGIEEVRAMVFADPEDVQADLVGMLDSFDQLAQTVGGSDGAAGVVVGSRGETVHADLHRPIFVAQVRLREPLI